MLCSDTLDDTERTNLPSVAISAIEMRRARCSSMDIGEAILLVTRGDRV